MKKINAIAVVFGCGMLMTGAASASSIVELGGQDVTQSSSIITLGDPCTDMTCGEPEADVAATDAESGDSNAALVDAYGMPTNMPVIMRPSMDAPAPATAAADPAAAPSPAAAAAPAEQAAPAPQPVTPQAEQPQQVQPQPEGQQPPAAAQQPAEG